PNDPVTAESYGRKPESYTRFLDSNGLRGMRFGVIRDAIGADADPNAEDFKEIQSMLTQAVADIRARGAEVVDPITIPNVQAMMDQSGGGGAEAEEAVNAYFARHPNAPLHTLKEIVDSPLLLPARRPDMAKLLGRTTNEPSYLKEQQVRVHLRTVILKLMADNRLDALLYSPANREPAPIPATTTPGSIRRFASLLAFPALGVPAGFNK